MNMKTRNIQFVLLLTAIFFGFLSSCKKDNADVPVATKPEIGTLEIGSGNNKTVKAGEDLHLEGDIVAEALIDKIEIDIHQEGGTFKFAKVYTDEKYVGKKNVIFHEHIDIPSEVPAGQYHFHLTVTDKAGNTTSVESPLTIQASDVNVKASYKLIFTEVNGSVHGDHFHDLADKDNVEPSSIIFDNSGKAVAGHAHLKPDGIYKIDFKQFDATGQEIQGQYIKDKATATLYKAFLTGGAFILNSGNNVTGAIFQPKESTYGDGSAVTGAIETTGITSYFTAGKDNEGEKELIFVLRKFKDPATKATITRADWNRTDYAAKYPGEDIIRLSFELHAEEGED